MIGVALSKDINHWTHNADLTSSEAGHLEGIEFLIYDASFDSWREFHTTYSPPPQATYYAPRLDKVFNDRAHCIFVDIVIIQRSRCACVQQEHVLIPLPKTPSEDHGYLLRPQTEMFGLTSKQFPDQSICLTRPRQA